MADCPHGGFTIMCKYCDADTVEQNKAKAILAVVNHYLRHGDYPHLDKGEFAVVAQALLAFITPAPEAAFDLKHDYRKLGLINAQCPRCLMDMYLPEPKHPLSAAGGDSK